MKATLAIRLLNALPAGAYELTALLGLLRIEESRDVPTAAVTCERRPVLKLNPDFVAERCASARITPSSVSAFIFAASSASVSATMKCGLCAAI